MRVTVLTTSYPRDADDVAGTFVRDGVEALRATGLEVRVVSPADFRHYGIAYGDGIVNNLRAAPWKLLALPLFLLGFARAARRASRDADVVHAHWLPSALPALAVGKPFVLQLWGSDVALARRARPLARLLVRRARIVVVRLDGARRGRPRARGARRPRRPERRPDPGDGLCTGRAAAPPLRRAASRRRRACTSSRRPARGLPLVVVGDGPLRALFPQAVGFVPPREVGAFYERAAVVVVPSRREGYGVTAREAMAYGRPVVATRVGGLVDAVEDGVTGLLVPPGDVVALRRALEELLADGTRRSDLGSAARAFAQASLGGTATGEALRAVYRDALRRHDESPSAQSAAP